MLRSCIMCSSNVCIADVIVFTKIESAALSSSCDEKVFISRRTRRASVDEVHERVTRDREWHARPHDAISPTSMYSVQCRTHVNSVSGAPQKFGMFSNSSVGDGVLLMGVVCISVLSAGAPVNAFPPSMRRKNRVRS